MNKFKRHFSITLASIIFSTIYTALGSQITWYTILLRPITFMYFHFSLWFQIFLSPLYKIISFFEISYYCISTSNSKKREKQFTIIDISVLSHDLKLKISDRIYNTRPPVAAVDNITRTSRQIAQALFLEPFAYRNQNLRLFLHCPKPKTKWCRL